MAVGDVVNALSLPNTVLTFQPAAGSECIITQIPTAVALHLTDGVNLGNVAGNLSLIKMFINNTNYLHVAAGGGAVIGWFTGLQIK
jgi:hypothetical protein|tara:strand:+ start:252 stop:509 length:258 start_codon:yes stop_codon:yes gene_type:complete